MIASLIACADSAQGRANTSPNHSSPARFWKRFTRFYMNVKPEGRSDMGQRTVLVIEDSPTERAMVRDCLQDAGYAVLEAGDGAEAHARLAAAPFDAIILDLILPDVNGYDLFRELQA